VAPALATVLSGAKPATVEPVIWTDVAKFYTLRGGAPAWVNHKQPTQKATEAIKILHTATDHAFDPADYGEAEITKIYDDIQKLERDTPDIHQRLAEFDVRLTAALLAMGRDVAIGRSSPKVINAKWKSRRAAPDLAATLNTAVDGDLNAWIDQMRPQHAEYVALQKALADVRGQRDKGGWPQVKMASLKPGDSNPAVVTLRQRLAASGHLKGEAAATNTSPVYDHELVEAVKSFQELHAVKASGVVDAPTLAAMNVPIDRRIEQIELNLERWRWMPDDFGEHHFMVNVPYFHLLARKDNKTVMDIRVVVGKPGNETPLFSDEMESVVFSPYWNIPDSIAQNETAPAMARDPAYLAKQNIEILRISGGGTVSASEVNWDDPNALRGLAFRQRPGSRNALGNVKFLFPNEHNVYLHDTPADSLFGRPTRAFSHGCMRVEEPEKLAAYVLQGYPEWTPETMNAAMHSGVEKHVKLKEKIPVHVVYFTAWVDEKDGLHFQPDIYGYDDKQAARQPASPAARRTN
jgi:murein L,D-transpeptidase YcbB/YkuD